MKVGEDLDRNNNTIENEKPKLKLEIPPPEDDGNLKERMTDGEEMRTPGPGFQDLKNCKRFWEVTNLIGTRKNMCFFSNCDSFTPQCAMSADVAGFNINERFSGS